MKKYCSLISIITLIILQCIGCQEIRMKGRPFAAINLDSISVVPTLEQSFETIVVPKEIKDPIPISEIIDTFYYIPLETTEESLFAIVLVLKCTTINYTFLMELEQKNFSFLMVKVNS